MIRKTLAFGTVIVGFAFAAGCYVGWKTTLAAVNSTKKKVTSEAQ